MSYLAQTLTLPAPDPGGIYDPYDPTSQFYCDGPGVDDPDCYLPGGFYGPGGPGFTPAGPVQSNDPYTLPVQVFNRNVPLVVPVGAPVATPAPIPTELNYPVLTVPGPSLAPVLAIGALLALLSMGKKRKA